MGIDRKVIRDWINKEQELKSLTNKKNKYRGKKNKGIIRNFSDNEETLIANWIIENRSYKKPISTKSLIAYAGTINENFSKKPINIQLQWAYRYLKRNGFSIRRITHQGQFIPEGKDSIKNKFIQDIIKKEKNLIYQKMKIIKSSTWMKLLVP